MARQPWNWCQRRERLCLTTFLKASRSNVPMCFFLYYVSSLAKPFDFVGKGALAQDPLDICSIPEILFCYAAGYFNCVGNVSTVVQVSADTSNPFALRRSSGDLWSQDIIREHTKRASVLAEIYPVWLHSEDQLKAGLCCSVICASDTVPLYLWRDEGIDAQSRLTLWLTFGDEIVHLCTLWFQQIRARLTLTIAVKGSTGDQL